MAQGVAQRLGAEAVAWVQGERHRRLAEETGCYARVVDLLAGLDAGRAQIDLQQNLDRIQRYEEQAEVHCFLEDVAVDRDVARIGWELPRIIHFAVHFMRRIDQQLERYGLPMAAMGEANTLAYRVAYRMLAPQLYYFYPTVDRTWPERFCVEQSISNLRPRCRQRYQVFVDEGVPPELKRLATEMLIEFREKALNPPWASRRGTATLTQKLRPHVAAVSASRWLQRLLEDDPNDPRPAQVRSPAVKLVTTGLEYCRKLAFDEFARAPAEDGMEYCSYFLHVEPEYSVVGLAFEFRNQLATIQAIASMLPGHMRLYVKEHRPMLGLRTRGFYKALSEMPNVLLLNDETSSSELVLGSRAVFTLTGTVGLEAMLNCVPVVVLGHVYFQSFHGVYPVRSHQELRATIRDVLSREDAGADDRTAVASLAALYASSYPGKDFMGYPQDEVMEPDNVRLQVEGITDALQAEGVGQQK